MQFIILGTRGETIPGGGVSFDGTTPHFGSPELSDFLHKRLSLRGIFKDISDKNTSGRRENSCHTHLLQCDGVTPFTLYKSRKWEAGCNSSDNGGLLNNAV